MIFTVNRTHAKPPLGGHRFPTGNAVLKAETVNDLLLKIEEYRAENALDLNFPEDDLGEYYSDIAPYLVQEEEGGRVKSMLQKIAETIMRFWKEHPDMLPEDSPYPELRKETCNDCPKRIPFNKEGWSGGPYFKKARQRAQLLSGVDFEESGLCGWSNLPIEIITRMKKITDRQLLPSCPKQCWVHSL